MESYCVRITGYQEYDFDTRETKFVSCIVSIGIPYSLAVLPVSVSLINSMEQPNYKKPATPGSWTPGRSGNPKGRPPKGSALTDAIRAQCDPAELVEIALNLARNGESESTRLGALNWLRDSGYTRPAEKHELAMGTPDDDEPIDISHLSLEQMRELVALDEKRDRLIASVIIDVAP